MKNLIIIIAFLTFFIQGCTEEEIIITNQGNITEFQLNVADFENVSLFGPVNLRITQGNTISASVETTQDIFDALTWKVKDQTLEIGFDKNVRFTDPDVAVWVNVSLPTIERINSTGLNHIVSQGDLDLPLLALHVSGIANIELTGKVGEQIINVSGVTDLHNFGLETRKTSVFISGTCDLEVSCSEKLAMDISGDAKISYKGRPAISQKVTGILDITDSN